MFTAVLLAKGNAFAWQGSASLLPAQFLASERENAFALHSFSHTFSRQRKTQSSRGRLEECTSQESSAGRYGDCLEALQVKASAVAIEVHAVLP